MAGALIVALLLACAPRAVMVGVVASADPKIELTTDQGRSVQLVLQGESEPVRYLDECTVQVTGPRVGRRIFVRDWTVISAADGSAPFVGVLELHGSNLILRDRNSGSILVLEERSAEPLRPFVGQPVMVIGFVAAAHVVQVMGWRVLAD